MPELPEVETVRQILEKEIAGKVLTAVEVIDPYSIIKGDFRCRTKSEAQNSFFRLIGKVLVSVERKGKYLFLRFDNDMFIIAHLKMTGNLLIENSTKRFQNLRHERVRLNFGDVVLRFNDVRKFGYLKIADKAMAAAVKSRLGPDTVDELNLDTLRLILKGSRRPIKLLLLDQTKISGIGNAYADEILYRSGIHPLRSASSIRGKKINQLYEAIVSVLKEGIEAGGLSLRDYIDAYGFRGDMQNRLQVYSKESKPCSRCGRKIKKVKISGRSSYFCDNCQN